MACSGSAWRGAAGPRRRRRSERGCGWGGRPARPGWHEGCARWDRPPACSRQRAVIQVQPSGAHVDADVLQDRAVPAGRVVDLGLRLGRQVDDLGVAAPSKLKMPFALQPCSSSPMSVRAGRRTASSCRCRSGRRRGPRPPGPHVGRAVHGHHVLEGQEVGHGREDGFLHLARIFRPADEHHRLPK